LFASGPALHPDAPPNVRDPRSRLGRTAVLERAGKPSIGRCGWRDRAPG